MNIYKLIIPAAIVLLLLSVSGFAADTTKAAPTEPATGEEINWQVISSGGTKGSSATYELEGTVGQPVIGEGSSATYHLSHGFWQVFGGGGGTCCNHDGIRGDADGSGSVNVGDPTYLTDYIFFSGEAPPCFEEGDADGNGSINVADPTYLTDYIFFGGPDPPACP
jgi:hypothetical protein